MQYLLSLPMAKDQLTTKPTHCAEQILKCGERQNLTFRFNTTRHKIGSIKSHSITQRARQTKGKNEQRSRHCRVQGDRQSERRLKLRFLWRGDEWPKWCHATSTSPSLLSSSAYIINYMVMANKVYSWYSTVKYPRHEQTDPQGQVHSYRSNVRLRLGPCWLKIKVVPVHAMKAYGVVKVQLHSILNSTLYGSTSMLSG